DLAKPSNAQRPQRRCKRPPAVHECPAAETRMRISQGVHLFVTCRPERHIHRQPGRAARDERVEAQVIELVVAGIHRNASRPLESALQSPQLKAIPGQRHTDARYPVRVRIPNARTPAEEGTESTARPERNMLGVSGPAKRQQRSREQSRVGAEHALTLRQESADYPRYARTAVASSPATDRSAPVRPAVGTGKLPVTGLARTL